MLQTFIGALMKSGLRPVQAVTKCIFNGVWGIDEALDLSNSLTQHSL